MILKGPWNQNWFPWQDCQNWETSREQENKRKAGSRRWSGVRGQSFSCLHYIHHGLMYQWTVTAVQWRQCLLRHTAQNSSSSSGSRKLAHCLRNCPEWQHLRHTCHQHTLRYCCPKEQWKALITSWGMLTMTVFRELKLFLICNAKIHNWTCLHW